MTMTPFAAAFAARHAVRGSSLRARSSGAFGFSSTDMQPAPTLAIRMESMNCRNFASIVVTLCTSAACGGPSQTAQPTVSPVASAPVAPASTVGESARGVDPPAASVSTTAGAPAATGAQPLTLDPQANPNLEFRIDAFSVPAASRAEFVAAMHANAAFLEKLPGFKGHTVLEKTSGPTTFNIVTIAAWESPEAMKNAGAKVREHYQAIGFDMQGSIARWGVTASIGSYHAPAALQ